MARKGKHWELIDGKSECNNSGPEHLATEKGRLSRRLKSGKQERRIKRKQALAVDART